MPHTPTGGPSGAVPDAWRALLARTWYRTMPLALRRSRFLAALYAAHALADASGALLDESGEPVALEDIARSCGAGLETARHHLDAALAAGVLADRSGVLHLVPSAVPDWTAAAELLAADHPTGRTA